jgi:hypothetical protein
MTFVWEDEIAIDGVENATEDRDSIFEQCDWFWISNLRSDNFSCR